MLTEFLFSRRTGITAIMTSFVFFLSLFFAPILASIPSWGTGCVLIAVGAMMARNTASINWDHPKDAIPAFLVMTVIPFSFNISYGLIAGILTWIILHNVPPFLTFISRGYIAMPPGWEKAEPYAISVMLANAAEGSTGSKYMAILPPWVRRMLNGKKDFWNMYPAELEAHVEGRRVTAENARRKEAEKEAQWDEGREAMRRLKEAGQDAHLPPHHREYPPVGTVSKRQSSSEEDESDVAEKKMEEGATVHQQL